MNFLLMFNMYLLSSIVQEHLSDRVAVMKEGSLQCCGTPLYLKDKFNLGWNLTVVMKKPESLEGADDMFKISQERITQCLRSYVPGAELARKAGRELTFYLPKESADLFADAFDAIEEKSAELGISSYGIENASFEEVFLLLAEKENNSPSAGKTFDALETASHAATDVGSLSRASESDDSISDHGSVATSDPSQMLFTQEEREKSAFKETENLKAMSFIGQIGLLYWKRFAVQKRDMKGAFFTIILPVMLVALVILVLTFNVIAAGPPLEMSPAIYENAYSSSSASGSGPSSEVLIGGEARHSSIQYLAMEPIMSHDYPTSKVTYMDKVATSEDMSRYLLESYNDHDHPVRYGAFSLEDSVLLNVTLNFTAFQKQIKKARKQMIKDNVPLRNKKVNVLQLFGLTRGLRRVSMELRVFDVFKKFIEWSGLHPYKRTVVSTVSASTAATKHTFLAYST